MHRARIYRPSKTAMQSGRGLTKRWVLELEKEKQRFSEPLMGWTGSKETLHQVRLTFKTAEEAIAYAKNQGWDYRVLSPQDFLFKPKSYADNFAPTRIRS